jgi:hypothetical protein
MRFAGWELLKTIITILTFVFSAFMVIFNYTILFQGLMSFSFKRKHSLSTSGVPIAPTILIIATTACYWTKPIANKFAAAIIIADLGYLAICYFLSKSSALPKAKL